MSETPDEPDPEQSLAEADGPWDAELVSMRNLLILSAVVFWAGTMAYAGLFQNMARAKFGVAFLGGILLIYLLVELMGLAGGGDDGIVTDLKRAYSGDTLAEALLLTACAAVITVTCAYLWLNFDALYSERIGRAYPNEIRMAAAFSLVMIYLTWRSFGVTFLAVVLAGIGYGYFGMYMPGPLQHGGLPADRILRILVVSLDGFFGFLTQLVAAWIALFLLYAGLLKGYGAFDLILRLAVRSAKYIDSGIAQTAVIASAVIGSVNGSQTANAGMTGSFTIPLMKENGVKPETSAGIEAVASTSGQVLPPVMGAGAFIMASLVVGITYADVIVAGLIPAAVLSVSIFVAVHYVAVPQVVDVEVDDLISEAKPRSEMILESLKYGIPLAYLIYLLGIVQVTVTTAALRTALTMIATGVAFPLIQSAIGVGGYDGPVDTLRTVLWQTLDGGREGAVVLAPVAIILAAINGVVDILTATGVPGAISLTLIQLSGGVMLIAVVMAMIICILLGLGMPTTAAYTVVALLIAPTLINQFLVPELAAHFFVFYAAILAGLTPPIATCVAVACGIAGANFWRSCVEAIKISAPLFVLPFVFVYHPEIVSAEFDAVTLTSGALALGGSIAIIHGINYRFVFGRAVTVAARVAFFVLGVLVMVYPDNLVRYGALALVVAMYLVQASVGRPAPIARFRGFLSALSGGGDVDATADPKRGR